MKQQIELFIRFCDQIVIMASKMGSIAGSYGSNHHSYTASFIFIEAIYCYYLENSVTVRRMLNLRENLNQDEELITTLVRFSEHLSIQNTSSFSATSLNF